MKYSVLTYIFGENYERVREIINKQEDVDYVLVTDNKMLQSATWNVIYWEGSPDMNSFDKVCYVRYHPFEFVHTNTVIKIDGSMQVTNGDLSIMITEFEKYDLALVPHPSRTSSAEEYIAWIQYRGYPSMMAEFAYRMLCNMGLDPNYKSLFQLGFSIERNDNLTKSINEVTYSLVKFMDNGHCHRIDQIIYSFVINKFFNYINILPLEEHNFLDGKYLQVYYHNSDQPLVSTRPNPKQQYVLNKLVTPVLF